MQEPFLIQQNTDHLFLFFELFSLLKRRLWLGDTLATRGIGWLFDTNFLLPFMSILKPVNLVRTSFRSRAFIALPQKSDRDETNVNLSGSQFLIIH